MGSIPNITSTSSTMHAKHVRPACFTSGKSPTPTPLTTKGWSIATLMKKLLKISSSAQAEILKILWQASKKLLSPIASAWARKQPISAEGVYHAEGKAPNVIGIIPGVDPALKDEVISLAVILMVWLPGAGDARSP
jgi:hypothetical protein